jgi:hypothetical protein
MEGKNSRLPVDFVSIAIIVLTALMVRPKSSVVMLRAVFFPSDRRQNMYVGAIRFSLVST